MQQPTIIPNETQWLKNFTFYDTITYLFLLYIFSPFILMVTLPVLAVVLAIVASLVLLMIMYQLYLACVSLTPLCTKAISYTTSFLLFAANVCLATYNMMKTWMPATLVRFRVLAFQVFHHRHQYIAVDMKVAALAIPLSCIMQVEALEPLTPLVLVTYMLLATAAYVANIEPVTDWPAVALGATIVPALSWTLFDADLRWIKHQSSIEIAIITYVVASIHARHSHLEPALPDATNAPCVPNAATSTRPAKEINLEETQEAPTTVKPSAPTPDLLLAKKAGAPKRRSRIFKCTYGQSKPITSESYWVITSKWASMYGFMMTYRCERTYSHCFVRARAALAIEWHAAEEKVQVVLERTRTPYSMVGIWTPRPKVLLLLLPPPEADIDSTRTLEPNDPPSHGDQETPEPFLLAIGKRRREPEPISERSKRQRSDNQDDMIPNIPIPPTTYPSPITSAVPQKREAYDCLTSSSKRQRGAKLQSGHDQDATWTPLADVSASSNLTPDPHLAHSSTSTFDLSSSTSSTSLKRHPDNSQSEPPSKRLCGEWKQLDGTKEATWANKERYGGDYTAHGEPDLAQPTADTHPVVETEQPGTLLLGSQTLPSEPVTQVSALPSGSHQVPCPHLLSFFPPTHNASPAASASIARRLISVDGFVSSQDVARGFGHFAAQSSVEPRPLTTDGLDMVTGMLSGLSLGMDSASGLVEGMLVDHEEPDAIGQNGLHAEGMVVDGEEGGQLPEGQAMEELQQMEVDLGDHSNGMSVDPQSGPYFGSSHGHQDHMDTSTLVQNASPAMENALNLAIEDNQVMDEQPPPGPMDPHPLADTPPSPAGWAPQTPPPAAWGSPLGSPGDWLLEQVGAEPEDVDPTPLGSPLPAAGMLQSQPSYQALGIQTAAPLASDNTRLGGDEGVVEEGEGQDTSDLYYDLFGSEPEEDG